MSIQNMKFDAANACPAVLDRLPKDAIFDLTQLLNAVDSHVESNPSAARRYLEKARAMLAEPKPTSGGLAPWQAKRISTYINDHIEESIQLADLAAVVKLSTSYFSKAFKSTFGEPPHAYVVSRRVDRAKELIMENDRPLAEIALDCGLCDQAHLSRMFRHATGVSPSSWRRHHAPAAI